MMAMLAVGAWAAEESIELTADAQGYANGDLVTTVQGDVVTLTFDKGSSSTAPAYYSTGDAVRLYNGGTMTITASGNTITKVVFVYELNGTATVSVTPGTYDASTKTWTGSSTEVVMTAGTAKHVRISKVTVTYEDGETPVVTVAAPTFSPAAGEVEAGTAVTISAPDAEMIVYTTDGTAPSYANNNGEIYTEPIVVNEAMTIKAIAVDADENESAVATAAYTIKPETVSVATVAEFNALADNTECTFAGDLVVSAQTGQYLYAQDATGGILIYGTAGQTYSRLDIIPAGWTCQKTTFKGAPEAQNMAGMQAATTQADLAAEEMTPAQVTLENAFKYAVIRGATISGTTLTVGGESTTIYNRFGVSAPTDNNTYDVIGVTGYYNNPQFMPLEYVANAVEVATPVISGETPFIGSTTVTITCEEEGVSIHYTLDGTDPSINSPEYTAPFELTETTTVKAIAFNEAEDCSVIVSKEFVKTITVATVAEFLALDDNTEFVFTGDLVVSGQASSRLYAQDETGGVLIYGNAGQTYTFGQVIPAGFGAKKANYNGTIEMTNMTGMQAATETAELVAAEIAIADYATHENVYAVVKGVTVDGNTLVIGEETLAIYNRFGVTFPTDDKTYDVYGVTTIYNNAPQLLPLEFVEVAQVVENTITFVAEQEGGTIAVALEDGTAVESGVTKVAAGAKVTVTATPAEGYKLSDLVVKCGDEVIEFDAEETTGRAAESHTFTMPEGEVSIEATFEEETPTGIENLSMENVKSVRYYNVAGVESATPFQGVNIVVREMNDGSKSVTKMVK